MNVHNTSLELFFEQKIFDLDDDEIEIFFKGYSENQVNEYLNKKIQTLSTNEDTLIEDTWKLGYTFGNLENSIADKFIVSKIYDSSLKLKEAYFKFLSGFWGNNIDNEINNLKKYSSYILDEDFNSTWNYELKMYSFEPIIIAYVNNKDAFMADNELSETIEIIKNYSQNNKFDSELKELLK